jgi:16S rRNA (guanine1207-N2)-methyltransferase
MSHYFIDDDNLKEDEKVFYYFFNNIEFKFTSNSGLFSHGHVDPASNLLIHSMPKLSGSLLDLGCGYGPIGIVLGKINRIELTMSDVNKRALEYAERNCIDNGVKAKIVHSDSFQNIKKSFNQITINPPIHAGKAVLFEMYEKSHEHLLPDGKLYIVIQKKHGALSTIKKLQEIFDNCDMIYKRKGYFVLASTKR